MVCRVFKRKRRGNRTREKVADLKKKQSTGK